MKFRNFLGVANTSQQEYFKEGVETIYPSLDGILRLAILPAYDPMDPSATGWLPAVSGDEESDFYTTVRSAKFVGHGNRRAKTAFISPRTFDLDADDPYEEFYDYCSRSDKWSYLTKSGRGKSLSGELEGAIFPRMKNYFVANVMDFSAGSRGGVFVSELSESVAKSLLYSFRKNGARVNGIAFERDDSGKLVFGDITDPKSALVVEIAFNGKAYVARPSIARDGSVVRTEIPDTLLQHRQHMEDPRTFLVHPGDGQTIVNRLAKLLRGYKSKSGTDEIVALEEAMKCAYGDKYTVDENVPDEPERAQDPFGDAADDVSANPEEGSGTVLKAVERGVNREKYKPANPANRQKEKPAQSAPGEDIDPSDIAAVRAMLSGK